MVRTSGWFKKVVHKRTAHKTLNRVPEESGRMKCDICGKTIGETFLKKIIGTHVKDEKGKEHPICHECQKKLQTKKKILEHLK